jgi:Fe-S-cluster containining protein
MTEHETLPAGDFSTWLKGMESAIRGEHASDVPCDGCTACCTARQFIHISPDESETLARIPKALLFPAPRAPRGHVLMGYDENGHCPMLVDDRCSIYEHRPRTCRTYDCRIFPATGLAPEDADIAARARRWEFTFSTDVGRAEHGSVLAASAYLVGHAEVFPDGTAPATSTALAVAALEAHPAFVQRDAATGSTSVTADPQPAAVRVALTSRAI